ncbi:carbohydrate-binding protein [Streptomyces sp. TG1A-60]|uniref:carbohydrate-binding protein n=1 Tax=Streptomyces sp. TG1A-60 TaxID=3129111 RepID=UPI0030CB0216
MDANHAGYSGTGFCNTDSASGAAARFTVEAAGSGTATVKIRYANGGSSDRPADIVVNGARAQSISFKATGAWADWATATVTLRLKAGDNAISLTATGSDGLPNIDYLDVTPGAA